MEAEALTAHGRSTGCANRSAGSLDAFVSQLTVEAGLRDATSPIKVFDGEAEACAPACAVIEPRFCPRSAQRMRKASLDGKCSYSPLSPVAFRTIARDIVSTASPSTASEICA